MNKIEILVYAAIISGLWFLVGFKYGVDNEKFSRDHANLKLQQCQAQLVSQ